METVDHTASRFFKSKGGSWTMRIGKSDQYNFFLQQRPQPAVMINKALERAIATQAIVEVTPADATLKDCEVLKNDYFKNGIPKLWVYRFQELGLLGEPEENEEENEEEDESKTFSRRSRSTQKVEEPSTTTSRRSKRIK